MFSPSTGIKKGNNTHIEARPRNKSVRRKKGRKTRKNEISPPKDASERSGHRPLSASVFRFVLFYFSWGSFGRVSVSFRWHAGDTVLRDSDKRAPRSGRSSTPTFGMALVCHAVNCWFFSVWTRLSDTSNRIKIVFVLEWWSLLIAMCYWDL